jgi:histidinol-phosphate/aromatic aminotransferase/cobyric acid decarboxylase-like protein
VLDLSVCINPFGPPAGIRHAIEHADITRYPDPESTLGRNAIAAWLGCPSRNVLLGNGAAELLWTLARVALGVGRRALVWRPCFSEFEAAAQACGAEVLSFEPRQTTSTAELNSAAVLSALSSQIERLRPQVLYLCAPESPLGRYVAKEIYLAVAQRFPDTTVIVDQSYLGLSRHASEITDGCLIPGLGGPKNLILVRSLTKELGTPGVRVGYVVLDYAIAERVKQQRPAWTVSAAAESAVCQYVPALDTIRANLAELLRLGDTLGAALAQLDCEVVATDTFYQVAKVPPAFATAAELRLELLQKHGVAIRDCASFGLPDYFRVAAHPDQVKLLAALSQASGTV